MMRRRMIALVGGAAIAASLTIGAAVATAQTSNPTGCFGAQGVELSHFVAYECLRQPSGLGGGNYWSSNVNSFNWDKHPGSGLLWVDAMTQLSSMTSNPVNPYDSFNLVVAGPNNGCIVLDAGYNEEPTQCITLSPTPVVSTMTSVQAASYEQWELAMEASGLPDDIWRDAPGG